MKPQKMKKLVLTKTTISNLENQKMTEIKGGTRTINPTFVLPDGRSCKLPCISATIDCLSQDCPLPTDDSAGPDVCGFCPA